jgi:lysine 2,3-aminomutase
LANRLSDEEALDRLPLLSRDDRNGVRRVIRVFPWAVTPYFLSLIRWDDPRDPLRRQVLPHPDEMRKPASGCLDPLAEKAHTVAPLLIRRYPDRAVLLATHRCAVLCRHCFRKRLWCGGERPEDPARWNPALRYLRDHPSIRDVLVSGGDPLTLSDETLDRLLGALRRIPHVEVIRVGSRVPVVLPQRITAALCRTLDRHAPVWLITQFNHPLEITPRTAEACEKLTRAGVPVNNQTVLLKGINDSATIQSALCRDLLRIRVRPYYLHQCDRVSGAEHFRTPIETGIEIVRQMRGTISGLAVPRFVVDLPGSGGKVPLSSGHLLWSDGSRATIRSLDGTRVRYENP